MSDKWIVFGRANCKWCDKAIELLESKGVDFDYYGIDTNPILKTVILGMGVKTVPAIFCNTVFVGGYEDIVKDFDLKEDYWEKWDNE